MVSRLDESNYGRGIRWALGSALCGALFLIPWKLAAVLGEPRINVLLLVGFSALFNTLAAPFTAFTSPERGNGRREWLLASQLALLTLFGNWMSVQGIAHLPAPIFSVVLRSDTLWAALLALLLLGERVRWLFWLGAGVAGLGLWLLQVAEPAAVGTVSAVEAVSGPLYGMMAAAAFAGMTVLTRKHIHEVDPVRLNSRRLWCAVAIWFLFNGLPPELAGLSRLLLGHVALAAFLGPGLSRLCLMYSSRHVPVWVTSLVTQTTPLFALVLSLLLFGELPSARELLGGVCMLVGVVLPVAGATRCTKPRVRRGSHP